MTKPPATCWNTGRFIDVIAQGSMHGSDGRRDNAAEASSESESAVALRHFSYWPRRIRSVRTRGPGRGAGGAPAAWSNEGCGTGSERGEASKRKRETGWESGRGRVRLYSWAKDRTGR